MALFNMLQVRSIRLVVFDRIGIQFTRSIVLSVYYHLKYCFISILSLEYCFISILSLEVLLYQYIIHILLWNVDEKYEM